MLTFFFSFIVLFDGIVVGERKNIYFDRTFFLLACIFSYFFRFFFYSLQPTHFQPHRKTTGEITFEVKRDLLRRIQEQFLGRIFVLLILLSEI